jgi:hypothetical protein
VLDRTPVERRGGCPRSYVGGLPPRRPSPPSKQWLANCARPQGNEGTSHDAVLFRADSRRSAFRPAGDGGDGIGRRRSHPIGSGARRSCRQYPPARAAAENPGGLERRRSNRNLHSGAIGPSSGGVAGRALTASRIDPNEDSSDRMHGRSLLYRSASTACSTRAAAGSSSAVTSSVRTSKRLSVLAPNVVLIATSAASRPRAIRMRPIRGLL